MVTVLVVQAILAALVVADTGHTDSAGKSVTFESSLDNLRQDEQDDNAVVIEGKS